MRARYKDKKDKESDNKKDQIPMTHRIRNINFINPDKKENEPKIHIELKSPQNSPKLTKNINFDDEIKGRTYRRELTKTNIQYEEKEKRVKTNVHLNPFFNFSNTHRRNKNTIFSERYGDIINNKFDNSINKMPNHTFINNKKNNNTIELNKDNNEVNANNSSYFLKYKNKLKPNNNFNTYNKNDNTNKNIIKIENKIVDKNKQRIITYRKINNNENKNDVKNDIKNENKNVNDNLDKERYNIEDKIYYNRKNIIIKLDSNNNETKFNTSAKMSARNYNKTKIAAKKIYELINNIYLKLYYPIFYRKFKLFLKFLLIYENKSLIHKILIFNDNKNLRMFFGKYHKIIVNERKKIETVKKIFEVYKKNELYELRKYFYKWKNTKIKTKKNKSKKISLFKRNQSSSGKKFIKVKMKLKKSVSHKDSFLLSSDDSYEQNSFSSFKYNSQLERSSSGSHFKKMKVIYVRTNKIDNLFLSEQHKKLRENLKKSKLFRKIATVIYKIGNKNLMFKYFKQWKKKRNRINK